MMWLDPDSVPTLGDWFRAGGYKTHYRGKWHISIVSRSPERDRLVGHGPFVTMGVLVYFVWAAGLASLLGGITVLLGLV